MRVGLVVLLRGEPGIVPSAAAAGRRHALDCARRTRPHVALVDYDLGDGAGLALCYTPKADFRRVVVCSHVRSGELSLGRARPAATA